MQGFYDANLVPRNPLCHKYLVKLWPADQGSRLALIERMAKNLSTPSIFSRKYGLLNMEEALQDAKNIEEVAFQAANEKFAKDSSGDGFSAVEVYSKESSRLMLDVLRRGPKGKEDKVAAAETIFDISVGYGTFIEADEAEKIFRPLKQSGNLYTKICFSRRSFGLDAARIAEPILKSIKGQLTEVDLTDIISGRPEAEGLEVINMFSSALEGSNLRCLNLSNNALGEKGMKAFRALLKSQKNLEELYLINAGISEEAAQAVSEFIPSTEKLKILHFHNNMTGDEGAVFIADILRRSSALEDFQCSSARVGSEGGVSLVLALVTCTKLQKLDLRDNMFGVDAGISLGKSLYALRHLTEIYLSYLNLEDEGAEAIANALKETATGLKVLDMAGNDITATGARSLAMCIAYKKKLTKLNLAENELNNKGAILISKALEMGCWEVKEVDLSSNSIGRDGAITLAQSLVQKSGFTLLNINGNFIPDEVIGELIDIFSDYPDKLGPLDENEPEGQEDLDNSVEDELDLKLKGLEIRQDD